MSLDTAHDDSAHADEAHADEAHEYGLTFWIGTVVGWAIIVYGAILLLGDDEAEWFNTVRLVAIGIVAHDGLWLAASIGTGWALTRLIGRKIPFWISWAGWTSAIVIALWLPLARGYGDRLNNDTILPRNYAASILILLPSIWVAAAIWGAISARLNKSDEGSDVDGGPA